MLLIGTFHRTTAAQFLIGGLAVALLTFVCFRLHADVTVVA
jgi:hypothetical protein